jgi:hypothetical protein
MNSLRELARSEIILLIILLENLEKQNPNDYFSKVFKDKKRKLF